MKTTVFTLILFMLFCSTIWAQAGENDRIFLNDGSIVRGEIVENVENDYLIIKDLSGNEKGYNYSEIKRILWSDDKVNSSTEIRENVRYEKRLYRGQLDKVTLYDGSVLTVRVVDFEPGQYVKMDTGNEILTLPTASIKSIDSKTTEWGAMQKSYLKEKRRKEFFPIYKTPFKKPKRYLHAYISFAPGNNHDGVRSIGVGGHVGLITQFKPILGVGFGMGVDNYLFNRGETLYPVYLSWKAILSKHKGIYFKTDMGYSFAFTNRKLGVSAAHGGIHLNPIIGFSWKKVRDGFINIELGVKWQRAYFEELNNYTDFNSLKKNLIYRRFNVKIGYML